MERDRWPQIDADPRGSSGSLRRLKRALGAAAARLQRLPKMRAARRLNQKMSAGFALAGFHTPESQHGSS